MPFELIQAMAVIKRAMAKVNLQFGLDREVSHAIQQAASEVLNEGEKYRQEFPLVVFQTGSGT